MSKNSSPPPEDLRTRRSKKLLWEALLSLLQEHAFSAITIHMISERAMVHRATFYTHFEGKYALLEYGIDETFQRIVTDLHWKKTSESHTSLLLPFFEYMSTHQEFSSLLLIGKGVNSLEYLIHRHMTSTMEAELLQRQKHGQRFVVPVPIITQFYVGALLNVMIWWVEQEMQLPPKELAHHMSRLLNQVLDTPTQK